MKSLFLTAAQAKELAEDLLEYSKMYDSSDRPVFEGFEISFNETLTKSLTPDSIFFITPIPHCIHVDAQEPE